MDSEDLTDALTSIFSNGQLDDAELHGFLGIFTCYCFD